MNAFRRVLGGTSAVFATALATGFLLLGTTAARADPQHDRYQQHNLVSDGFVHADHLDPNLVNAWGIAFNPFGPAWIADNGTGVSTLYDGSGIAQPTPPLIVTIPPAAGADSANPTGIVFNGSPGFVVTKGGKSASAKFLFVTEDGVLAGWSPTVDATNAVLVKDNSPSGAVYKGLALSAGGSGALLYASDFHNGKIEVWDSNFASVALPAGAFADPAIPAGFGPFGIQAISGNVYVTYAKQDADRHDDVKGKGLGFVDVFDPNGNLIRRVVTRGRLNAPWGLALSPAGFGELGDSLLVGNFGDGHINAFDLATGEFVSEMKGTDGKPVVIDGLWGLAFGNGFANQPVNTLFFTAGPDGEAHGLYGRLDHLPRKGNGHGDD